MKRDTLLKFIGLCFIAAVAGAVIDTLIMIMGYPDLRIGYAVMMGAIVGHYMQKAEK